MTNSNVSECECDESERVSEWASEWGQVIVSIEVCSGSPYTAEIDPVADHA
jgi:hypothetical protein